MPFDKIFHLHSTTPKEDERKLYCSCRNVRRMKRLSRSTHVAKYIENRDWKKLRSCFSCNQCKQSIKKNSNRSFVLLACQNYAPDDIILQLCQLNPDSILARDLTSKQYPLHIAALNGLSDGVIDLLAYAEPDVAREVDSSGRTPLHLACSKRSSLTVRAANILCAAGPSALGMEDCDGATPMELIITSGGEVDLKVLDVIHTNTGRYWSSRRKVCGEMYRLTHYSVRRRARPE